MKLVKFKNIYNPHDHNFNVYLRDQVAYLVDLRYIVPMEFLDNHEIMELERNHDHGKILDILNRRQKVYWDTIKNPKITEFVDMYETNKLNIINLDKNHFNDVFDRHHKIPIAKLKKFRTWLATGLNIFVDPHDEVWRHVLHYYMKGMFDETMKWLDIFSDSTPEKSKKDVACGCSSSAKKDYTTASTCNTLQMYRLGIYNAMVDKFSNIQYWATIPESFLREFKSYIDNILKTGLTVDIFLSHKSIYADCGCQQHPDEGTMFYKGILERLSNSLNYIIHNDVTGHLNFISKALNEFAAYLYEKMEWD